MASFVLIVQGEGRGHLSQAMAMAEYLVDAGYTLEAVFAGSREPDNLPGYFRSAFGTKLELFRSPFLLRTPNRKGIYVGQTILYNLGRSITYLREAVRLRNRINLLAPDVVFNLYDLVGALALRRINPGIRRIGVGHHFLLHLENYHCPGGSRFHRRLISLHTNLVMRSCDRVLALSFREVAGSGTIRVIPPLIRKKVRSLTWEPGERYLVYLLTGGFLYDLVLLAREKPGFVADVFTDLSTDMELPPGIKTFTPDEKDFTEKLSCCRAVITTAGFDLAAEAAFLGIPLAVIPVRNHFEQWCNSYDVDRSRVGIRTLRPDAGMLDRLGPSGKGEYRDWASRAGALLIKWSFE
jgi:uncharacterized protein (TIGR00661 family)